jgi:beta-galactosidase/beta-glucuronidase
MAGQLSMRTARFLTSTILLFTLSFASRAAFAVDLPAATSGPARINLSGMWDFRFDPQNQGEGAKWFAVDADGAWTKAAVPGSFNEEFAKHPGTPDPSDANRFFKGKAWYRTTFPYTASDGSDQFLHLSGTVLRQKVWLNGKFVGESTQPYLDVSYDITSLLAGKRFNTLVIEVDNSVLPHAVPDAKWRGWWDDGGLIWPVYIEERSHARSDSYVTTKMLDGGAWQFGISTVAHQSLAQAASADKAGISWCLTDAENTVVWQQKRTLQSSAADIELKLSADLKNIHPWSPDTPVLYRLTVTVTASGQSPDVVSFRVGFRQIEARGSQLLLNGKPIILRGINRHEFLAGAGMSLTPAENRKDMEDLKALGANFTRLAHYPQSQDVYDLCDELGLLVWSEIPVWQSSIDTLADPEVWNNYAAPQLNATIRQHRNHPSVIIWSVANEIPTDKPEGAAYIAKAIHLVHQLDSSRLATFASDKRERDTAFGSVDLIAVNEYFGWYYGGLNDVGPMLDNLHVKYPTKPIMVSEYGSEAVASWSAATAKPGSKDFSYGYQAKFLESHMEQIYAPSRAAYIAGGTIWVYGDFPDPHRIGGDHPVSAQYRNNKGLVTLDRTRKPAYDTVQQFFHALAERATSMQSTHIATAQ